jgi:lipoate-protein ligase A
MDYLDLTLPTPEENIALDEALLDEAETAADRGSQPRECLRLWEPAKPMVVVGRNSKIEVEVDVAFCQEQGIPVLRRASGGCAIVTGPGCLMYAVVLTYQQRPELRQLDEAHRLVLDTLLKGLRPLVANVDRQGTCDLVVGPNKFSGNSLRCRRNALLYHGTLLYDFPLTLVSKCLKTPPREPAYRAGREHAAFVMNLPVSAAAMKEGLRIAWSASEVRTAGPEDEVWRMAQRLMRPPEHSSELTVKGE